MLRPLQSKRRWVDHRTYDLEWDPATLKVRIAGVYDGTNYWWYKSAEEMLDHQLTPQTSGMTFYAHNSGRSDFVFLLHHLRCSSRDFNVDVCFSNSAANIVLIRQGRCKWRFVDSLWLFRTSLASIGESIGLPKIGPAVEDYLGPDADERKKEWFANAPLAELREYNKRDCEILWHAIHLFQCEIWDLGGELKLTIASTSMGLFRRRYLPTTIATIRSINAKSRKSYTASRVEVLRSKMGRGAYYDINSSFPFSLTKPQPGALKRVLFRLPDVLDQEVPLVLAECAVEVPECELPPLALREKGKVYYPIGRWRGWFTGVDLRALVERGGRILKFYRGYEFHPFTALSSYVLDIYSRRKRVVAEGDAFKSVVYKILLNSLYGKFAEGPDKTGMIINPTAEQMKRYNIKLPENEEDTKESEAAMWKLGCFTVPKTVKVPHEHVPVASNVTAFSRLLILEHMERAYEKGGAAYYCDTDGFATDIEYETTPELGGLKCEALIESADFYCPKVYRFSKRDGTKVHKAKGYSLPRKNPQKCEERFNELVDPENAKGILIERLSCVQEMLRRRKVLTPYEIATWKRLLLLSPKRHFYADGKSRPWDVSEVAPDRVFTK